MATTFIFVISVVLILNILIDPLWYFSGNKILDRNFVFNERVSKTNLFLKNSKSYDCLIFGSSRTTLLNAKKIKNAKCFNFAFSNGTALEILKFASYALKYSQKIKKIIIGIDGFNFYRSQSLDKLPEYIINQARPTYFMKNYLSIDSFRFSMRTLLYNSPHIRYYNSKFQCLPIQSANSYTPPRCINSSKTTMRFNAQNIKYYQQLVKLFPESEIIAYVPPISFWEMAPLYFSGDLDNYTQAIFNTSKLFERFYDFSIPSDITTDAGNTYDGDHFSIAVNDQIAEILNSEKVSFGVELHKINFAMYQRLFKNRFESIFSRMPTNVPVKPTCKTENAFFGKQRLTQQTN